MKICFLDTETTSLRHDRRMWEVGIILRDEEHRDRGDCEYHYYVHRADLDLGNADLMSLQVGRFHERYPWTFDLEQPPPWASTTTYREAAMLHQVEDLTTGVTIVGAVPWFDTEVLGNRMRAHGILPAWYYHLVDIEALAAGRLGMAPPWDFDAILAAYGLSYEGADRHTALGDARMVRDLYDRVLAGGPDDG